MKIKLKLITILLVVTYLCFAFIRADLNAFNWSVEVRVAFVLISAFFSIALLSYPQD